MPVSFDKNALKDYVQSLSKISIVKNNKLILAPVRHHSPACAHHVRSLIRQYQPKTVLIEAPIDFEPLIPLLVDKRTIPPIAIAAFLDEKSFLRRASYYPFCSHSPEYIAIKTAKSIAAEIKFVDLPSSHRLMHEIDDESDIEQSDALSLLDEHLLDSSDYIQALAKRLGCRDGAEVWDHLFESRLNSDDPIRFFADVGAYCYAIRAATPALQINTDDTLPREAHMISCLIQALEKQDPVLMLNIEINKAAVQ